MLLAQLAKRGFYAENTTGGSTSGWSSIETISDETLRFENYQYLYTDTVMVIIWVENPSAIRQATPSRKDYPLRAGTNIVYIPSGSWGVLEAAGKFQLAAIPL